MRRSVISVVLSFVLCGPASADRSKPVVPDRIPVVDGPGVVMTSSGTANGVAERETAGPDTFVLYGGPDHPTEGKFQLADGVTADWGDGSGMPGGYGGGPDAWTPVDRTHFTGFWHRDMFNAETLNDNGPGNHAMWSGVDVDDPRGADWHHLPGYGNSWNDVLIYESAPLIDTSVGEVVALEFYFHHDTEPGFDYFNVHYDSAGTWTSVLAVDGSNKDASNVFQPPGVQFSTVQTAPIEYSGNDFGGENNDKIRIRLLVSSDGAYSDQDGLWPTTAGAAQVDDITLTTSQGTFTEDYELVVPTASYLFHPDQSPFCGDFADVYPRLTDIDPCRENITPVAGFIDYNQIVRNGPAPDGTTRTGGTPPYFGTEYGIPGAWCTNWTGGITQAGVALYNEIWSPVIAWDLPGPDDDAPEFFGAAISFDVWTHLPLNAYNFYVWAVRYADPGEPWSHWIDRNLIYYHGGRPEWSNQRQDVSDLLGYKSYQRVAPGQVQVSLGVLNYSSIFGFPPSGSTPAPCFDNVTFSKYRLEGPTLATRTIDTAQDGFPVLDSIDVSTQAARDALDIPFDMARDINTGDQFIMPGDSLIVDVESIILGTLTDDVRLFWKLHRNPLFEDAIRQPPDTAYDENVVSGPGDWSGEVVGWLPIYDFNASRFVMTLPDVDFMYPGDVLHYYFQATDTDGRSSTLPHDISGFGVFGPDATYDRAFTVRGLPSIRDASGTQPGILVINDFGRRGNEDEFTRSFTELGYVEGIDYDTYTVQGPTSAVSNGIGSHGAHGSTAAQLSGYNHVFYLAGDLSSSLLSDGSNRDANDKGDDLGVLEAWHALPGARNVAYFGDNIASGLTSDSAAGSNYLATYMGVDLGDESVHDAIGGQTAPLVAPASFGATWFDGTFAAYGGCAPLNQFDQIQSISGAFAGHHFLDVSGQPITDPASGVASVIYPHSSGVGVTFPYSVMFVYGVRNRTEGPSARSLLFADILEMFSASPGTGVDDGPARNRRIELAVFPNPFNPVTVVSFTAPIGSKGSVKVFNLRGELVRTLHSGAFASTEFRWDGVDDRGASVASGVYVIKAEAEGKAQTKKVALVK